MTSASAVATRMAAPMVIGSWSVPSRCEAIPAA